jgi:hypothetical protein
MTSLADILNETSSVLDLIQEISCVTVLDTGSAAIVETNKCKRYEWTLLKSLTSEEDLDDFIYYELPYSRATAVKNNTWCKFSSCKDHKMVIQRRDCREENVYFRLLL